VQFGIAPRRRATGDDGSFAGQASVRRKPIIADPSNADMDG